MNQRKKRYIDEIILKKYKKMKRQVIENFDEWIFEAAAPKKPAAKAPAAPKKPAAPVVPAGYKKTTLPAGGIQLLTNEEVLKAKGWKALADTDSLQLTALKTTTPGFVSDKVEDFNKSSNGVLVMGPSIYGKGENMTSFIVGFPFQQESLEGEKAKNIVLSEKYVLFTPWENGEANVFKGAGSGAAFPQPYDFRLIPTDRLPQIGLQSLLWIIGFNNSAAAKKALLKFPKDRVIEIIKEGLTSLSKSSTIANANKSGKIIFDGYNALVSSPMAHQIIFNNFVDGHPKIGNVDDLKEKLPLKTA
jgi:hypothetical protein